MELESSFEYKSATEEQRASICNGCGSARAKFDFVPDSIWGLDITPACHIHDWDYHFGSTQADRDEADARWHRNMVTLIISKDGFLGWSLRGWRLNRANLYYGMVRWKGDRAFWEGKKRV